MLANPSDGMPRGPRAAVAVREPEDAGESVGAPPAGPGPGDGAPAGAAANGLNGAGAATVLNGSNGTNGHHGPGPGPAVAPSPRRAVPLLDCRGIQAGYDGVQVLFDVDLRVDEGQIVALMGTNGAGKTTLLRVISGLLAPTEGAVTFGGVDITSYDPTWRVRLGMNQIAGGESLAPGLTVAENLRMFSYSLGRRHQRAHAGIDAALEQFPRLAERRNQPASTLSGGEKQMLALAKAFVLRPRLLVIDEFSLGLAPKIVGELLPVVEQLNATGTSVLLVEQSVNVALSVAHHAVCMEKGEMVYDGPAAALRDQPDLLRSVYLEGISRAVTS